MNNTLRIRSLLKDISVPHHFIFKKGAYFRVIEDVAQGFHLMRKQRKGCMLYNIQFSIAPLCDPKAGFYKFTFDGRDICFLIPQLFDKWPFFILDNEPDTVERCMQEITFACNNTLFPHFDQYHSCKCAYPDLPELKGFKGMDNYSIYFALKNGQKESALRGIRRLMQQRQDAYRINSQYGLQQPTEKQVACDVEISNFYKFLEGLSDQELEDYLQLNEQRAKEFLIGSG